MRHDAHYVDNLVFREGEVVGRMLALDEIYPNPDQPRKDFTDIESLADSIREQGIIEPIIVNKESAGYMIISGERRYRASKQVGLKQVPCVIKNLDKNQIMEVALVENLQRKDLHPFEEADGLKELSRTFNYTHEFIAKKIGKSRTTVTETLTLAELTSEVRKAAQEASITAKSMLLSVARLETLDEQLEMIERIASGADRNEVRARSKKQERSKAFVYRFKPTDKSFTVNLKFKKSEVTSLEMIEALEGVLQQLREEAAE
jgi:ParB family chromosome partitioning protein